MADSVQDLQARLRVFAAEREWDQFHLPRSLVLALAGEVGEVAAELQWLRDDELERPLPAELAVRLAPELADVLLYLVRLADVCGVDLLAAAAAKMTVNADRYPVSLSRGNAAKYTTLAAGRDGSAG